jgi:hypothetical protein
MLLTFLKSIPPKYYAAFLIGAVIFWIGGMSRMSCHHCPTIQGHSETVKWDTIWKHDTIKGPLPASSISVKPNIKPIFVAAIKPDSSLKPIEVQQDTQYCYETQWAESDSAKIGVKICSYILPQKKPVDFTFDKWYVAPPAIVKTLTVKDTVAAPMKKFYVGVGGGVGYGIDATGRKGWNTNVGVQFGIALKQF